MSLENLYREIVMDHSKDPRNFGKPKDFQVAQEGFNPLCGDKICVYASKDPKNQLSQIVFEGEGCSICMASASMMTEEVDGKSLDLVLTTISAFRDMMQGKDCPLKLEGDLMALSGVRNFPVRIKCAVLPWTTLKDAIDQLKISMQISNSESVK